MFIVSLFVQIKEETAKLIELKKELGDDQGNQKFVLKTPKVNMIIIMLIQFSSF